MKQIILSIMLLFTLTATAQNVDNSKETYFVYCVINIQYDALIIIGEDKESYNITDESNNKLSFEYGTNIRTYMSKKGWEYVERSGFDYVFRKKVVNEQEAFSDFILVYKNGKNKGKIRQSDKKE